MKVWVTSDIHVDFSENFKWFTSLSSYDYTEDILIIAGDVIHDLRKMRAIFQNLSARFFKVLFVPGNHDLWLWQSEAEDSLEKFEQIMTLAQEENIQTFPYVDDHLTIIPLFSWYDFSFGQPSESLQAGWNDFLACKWPMNLEELTLYFLKMNEDKLSLSNQTLLSFSHFMPFKSLLPDYVPQNVKNLLPVFGSQKLGEQLHQLQPDLHIYGHSHLNRRVKKDGAIYLNNAFGYPREHRICRKKLLCVYENGNLLDQ